MQAPPTGRQPNNPRPISRPSCQSPAQLVCKRCSIETVLPNPERCQYDALYEELRAIGHRRHAHVQRRWSAPQPAHHGQALNLEAQIGTTTGTNVATYRRPGQLQGQCLPRLGDADWNVDRTTPSPRTNSCRCGHQRPCHRSQWAHNYPDQPDRHRNGKRLRRRGLSKHESHGLGG